jgi:pyruvate carboxylase
MDRGLREFRIRGLATNLQFVENVINHPDFVSRHGHHPLHRQYAGTGALSKRRDRATRILRYLGEVTVNGHPDMKGRIKPDLTCTYLVKPSQDISGPAARRARPCSGAWARRNSCQWMKDEPRALITDTTLRDAHQSLFATRMRTGRHAAHRARTMRALAGGLFSLECWGGATFDVAMRFLREDPWARLAALREAVPNVLFQMLLRSSNAVGYTNYADNVVRHFVGQAAGWRDRSVPRVRFAQLGGRHAGGRSTQCLSPARCARARSATPPTSTIGQRKYDLGYYVKRARELECAGVHILGTQGHGRRVPAASRARKLIPRAAEETGLPVHFHTHDTVGRGGRLGAGRGGGRCRCFRCRA